jgi:hypothetical protein
MLEQQKINHKFHSNLSNEENEKEKEKEKFDQINYFLIYKKNYIIKFNLIVHNSTEEEYNVKVINDIIYNEDKCIVSKFKDHLIYNDPAEFLRRYKNLILDIKICKLAYNYFLSFIIY